MESHAFSHLTLRELSLPDDFAVAYHSLYSPCRTRWHTVGFMWLPIPTPAAVRRLRSLMEADLSVKLSDEEWTKAATKLLQIHYLQFYGMGDELARQDMAALAETRKEPTSGPAFQRTCNGGENDL